MAKNALGKVVASRSMIHADVGSGFAAEAFACLWVVQTKLNLGFTNVIIEGDSL